MLPYDSDEHAHCRSALGSLDRILEEKPERHHDEVLEAVRCMVTMRDAIIARRRGGGDVDDELEQVNAVLSVLTAGSFPVVGLRHERLARARDLLACLMEKEPVAHPDGRHPDEAPP
ncbi:hypothetical protein [Caenispirillum bisanense]|uniref:hypothetical protein n=1 Tax=Caenispirillum bisanense TaxID=414052 RepID=UPI0031D87D71